MKKLFILAVLVAMPVIAGCTCPPVEPEPVSVCPPVVQPTIVAAQPVVQPTCPPAIDPAVTVKPMTVYPVTAAPLPLGGQITYAQPIQVSGVNGVVQYYNPYVQSPYIQTVPVPAQ